MPKYTVILTQICSTTIEVEAANVDAAIVDGAS